MGAPEKPENFARRMRSRIVRVEVRFAIAGAFRCAGSFDQLPVAFGARIPAPFLAAILDANRRLHSLRGHWQVPHPDARGIGKRIAYGSGRWPLGGFARAEKGLPRAIDHVDLYRIRHSREAQDGITAPVAAG